MFRRITRTRWGVVIATAVASGVAGTLIATVGNGPNSPDTSPPVATLASVPAGNLSGTETITATCSDNVACGEVDLLLDGAPVLSTATGPYSFSWDTSQVSQGTHTIAIEGIDTAGNVGVSSSQAVTVNPGCVSNCGVNVNLTNQAWKCSSVAQPVTMGTVKITITDQSLNINAADLSGCSGTINRLEVDQESVDAIKTSMTTTNLTINGGYVRCHGRHGTNHQDGQQGGGVNVTFNHVEFSCWTANDVGGLFVNVDNDTSAQTKDNTSTNVIVLQNTTGIGGALVAGAYVDIGQTCSSKTPNCGVPGCTSSATCNPNPAANGHARQITLACATTGSPGCSGLTSGQVPSITVSGAPVSTLAADPLNPDKNGVAQPDEIFTIANGIVCNHCVLRKNPLAGNNVAAHIGTSEASGIENSTLFGTYLIGSPDADNVVNTGNVVCPITFQGPLGGGSSCPIASTTGGLWTATVDTGATTAANASTSTITMTNTNALNWLKDGTPISIGTTGSPSLDGTGTVTLVCVLATDENGACANKPRPSITISATVSTSNGDRLFTTDGPPLCTTDPNVAACPGLADP